ncbi:MAG: translation elongation factor Ts [Candidatus Babeliales bacterium]
MAKIDKDLIQDLRNRTGCGMMDCKKALEETGGDIDKSIEILRKKGASIAEKRSGNKTAEGIIEAYIHPGNQVGVLIELNCETDFVARTAAMHQFAKDVAMHIAALRPEYLKPEDADPKFVENELRIIHEQLTEEKKPEKMIAQIAQGKLKKILTEKCLLEQPFVKNDKITVHDALKELIAKLGENIVIKRFCRFEIGA